MEVKFTIPYPQKGQMKHFCKEYGLNSIYAGKHWARRKADKEDWHYLVEQALNSARPLKMFDKPVRINFYWNDNLDCSNHAYMGKMIEDCLKGYIIKDDSRRYIKEICHKFHDEPFIAVEIMEA